MVATTEYAYTEETFIGEFLPQVLESYVLELARAEPAFLRTPQEMTVIVPFPNKLLEDVEPGVFEGITTEKIKARLPHPFSLLLESVEPFPDPTILDKDGEVIFDLLIQDMKAIRFVFTTPRLGIFDEDAI